ncbi:MAG: hypothetical protein KBE04_09745 [Phycisphaerae bacterium]|nr:hypothetical protein [Phycisphaerae bacterium]
MSKTVVFTVLLPALCLGPAVRAERIVWVSDNSTPTAGVPADKGWVDLLRGEGYTVDYAGEGGTGTPGHQYWRTLDDMKIAELNAADLIIVSRNTDSAAYDDGSEVAQWNAVRTPILSLSAYMVRSHRWGWVNTSSSPAIADATMEVVLAQHPVFKGVTLGSNNQIDVVASSVDGFAVTTSAGNGTLIARRADNGQVWIAEWEADVEYYSGSGRSAAGKRLYFAGGSSINLTAEGRTLFLNAAKHLVANVSGQATSPLPADRATDVLRAGGLAWTPGPFAAAHDVYLGSVFADVNTASRTSPNGVLVSQGQDANTYDPIGLLAFGQTYYWRIDEVNAPPDPTVHRGRVWSFTAEPYTYAIRPTIATASSVHDATTGPEKTVDRSGLNAQDQHSTTGTDMWLSSATAQMPAWTEYDFNDAYKLQEMWVWNSNQMTESVIGSGAKQVAVEFSQDGSTWIALPGVPVFAQATGSGDYVHNTTVEFGGILARCVKLTIQSNWGGLSPQCGLSEVRFFQVPTHAFDPSPMTGAANVGLDATLSWRSGREAVLHRVYVGADSNGVDGGTASTKAVTESQVGLGGFSPEYGRTYYWKVDEVNEAGSLPSWPGTVWSFSMVPYGVLDDFESYDDQCSRVYYVWKSGARNGANPDCGVSEYNGNGTGSTVGNNDTPYAERTAALVHAGRQSMPFWYDNTKSPFYSEASREWSTPQSWSRGGADALAVYYRFDGQTQGFAEVSPGVVVMNGMGTDIYGTSDEGRFVYKQLSGDGTIVARVENLANTESWAKAGVMIRETLDAGSPFAIAVYGGTNGVRIQMRLTAGGGATSDSSTATAGQLAARAPVWVRMERTGNEFRGYYSADGQVWAAMSGNPQTIVMARDVYIGLAVTSHVTGVACGARFSGVSTTGAVTGTWQPADLGVAQAAGGDVLEPVYLVVEDSEGKSKVVAGLDPTVTIPGAWEEWAIPFSDLRAGGVNLSSVRKVTIGVGNNVSPKAGGTGKLYIDDLRLTKEGP